MEDKIRTCLVFLRFHPSFCSLVASKFPNYQKERRDYWRTGDAQILYGPRWGCRVFHLGKNQNLSCLRPLWVHSTENKANDLSPARRRGKTYLWRHSRWLAHVHALTFLLCSLKNTHTDAQQSSLTALVFFRSFLNLGIAYIVVTVHWDNQPPASPSRPS